MVYNENLTIERYTMKNKILGYALTPVFVPLVAIQLHYAGKPSAFEKDQARRQKKIDKIQARRYNR
jgi:hypothetical protein